MIHATSSRFVLSVGFALTLGAGCESAVAKIDLERMIRQKKCLPYSTCRWLPDNRTMQMAPAGTVPRRRIIGRTDLTEGSTEGEPVATVPIDVDMAVMRRGADRFEIFCAPCHGVLGDGLARAAENMHLRRPPSLHEPRITTLPPGRIFQIVTRGYGLMPSYAAQLSLEDRWAVVAYVGALQLSQRVVLVDQPEATRDAILETLP